MRQFNIVGKVDTERVNKIIANLEAGLQIASSYGALSQAIAFLILSDLFLGPSTFQTGKVSQIR